MGGQSTEAQETANSSTRIWEGSFHSLQAAQLASEQAYCSDQHSPLPKICVLAVRATTLQAGSIHGKSGSHIREGYVMAISLTVT